MQSVEPVVASCGLATKTAPLTLLRHRVTRAKSTSCPTSVTPPTSALICEKKVSRPSLVAKAPVTASARSYLRGGSVAGAWREQ